MFGQLFKQADSEGLGVVTGEVAVKFFERTRLPPAVLGEVSLYAGKHFATAFSPRPIRG